jgi:hypothetical protein
MPTGILRSILEDAPRTAMQRIGCASLPITMGSFGAKRAFLPLEPGFYYSKFSLCKAQKIKRN